MMNASTGHFDIINLNAALFTPGVVYTITVNWYCGGKKCTCDIKFRFKDCDCKCGEFTNVFFAKELINSKIDYREDELFNHLVRMNYQMMV